VHSHKGTASAAGLGWVEVLTHVRMVAAGRSQAVVLASSAARTRKSAGNRDPCSLSLDHQPATITAPVPARCIKGLPEVHRRYIEGGHARADGREQRNYEGLGAIAPTRRRGRGGRPFVPRMRAARSRARADGSHRCEPSPCGTRPRRCP
jgi:hypothetical protein